MGKPSHDRVRFFLSAHRIECNQAKFDELLDYAFDTSSDCVISISAAVDLSKIHWDEPARPGGPQWCEGVVIVCRPSQFARFLIRRNELGLNNGFKELHPHLFVPKIQQRAFLDVSKRAFKPMGHGCAADDEGC